MDGLDPPTNWTYGTELWTHVNADRRRWAVKRITPRYIQQVIDWSEDAVTRLTKDLIRDLRDRTTTIEWAGQWNADEHGTSAPLTFCKTSTGLSLFLAPWSSDTYKQQIRRARFLCGRARTATVHNDFNVESERIDPRCTFPACMAKTGSYGAVIEDSIQHVLLHCPRHDEARRALSAALTKPPLPFDLSQSPDLHTILTASCPSTSWYPFNARGHRFTRQHHLHLLRATAAFLEQIERDREAATPQCLPLDTG